MRKTSVSKQLELSRTILEAADRSDRKCSLDALLVFPGVELKKLAARFACSKWKWEQVWSSFKEPQAYLFFFVVIINAIPTGGTKSADSFAIFAFLSQLTSHTYIVIQHLRQSHLYWVWIRTFYRLTLISRIIINIFFTYRLLSKPCRRVSSPNLRSSLFGSSWPQ